MHKLGSSPIGNEGFAQPSARFSKAKAKQDKLVLQHIYIYMSNNHDGYSYNSHIYIILYI